MESMRLLLIMVATVSAASAALASDEQDCFQGREPQLRIRGCSEIILRAPNDATAYHNRAVAYGLAGDIDNAIVDYTKVIEIAPSNVSAYDNRGRAYASKGDYTHAVEDETMAHELLAKAAARPIVVSPKVLKAAKATASTPKTAKSAPTANSATKANNEIAKEGTESSWWSFLNPFSNGADQASGKKVKP